MQTFVAVANFGLLLKSYKKMKNLKRSVLNLTFCTEDRSCDTTRGKISMLSNTKLKIM